jgi:hypothetical protein
MYSVEIKASPKYSYPYFPAKKKAKKATGILQTPS